MIPEDEPTTPRQTAVPSRAVEIVLAEENAPLSFIGLPIVDLHEMEQLRPRHFSLKDHVSEHLNSGRFRVDLELKALRAKEAKFGKSPVYWNRLANWATQVNDIDSTRKYLDRAIALSGGAFYIVRKADSLIASGDWNEAHAALLGTDVRDSVGAKLRLAFFEVHHSSIDSAIQLVNDAVNIDPLDFGARLFQGALRIVRGDMDGAVLSLKIALEERPTSSSAAANLAVAYWYGNRSEKALSMLRRAVVLDPLNINAVSLLADVSSSLGVDSLAISVLRRYLEWEQKDAGIWGRLARALLRAGDADESIAALKRQGSLEMSAGVWNNLGVAYTKAKDKRKALESFKYAMELEEGRPTALYLLAARNSLILLSETAGAEEVYELAIELVRRDKDDQILHDRALSDLLVVAVSSLLRASRFAEAVELARHVMSINSVSDSLRARVGSQLIGYYSLAGDKEAVFNLVEQLSHWQYKEDSEESQVRSRLLNNIAFSFAEFGRLSEAERWLSFISKSIHKEPYPTATLGLIHLRRGHLKRGEGLYREAIALARRSVDKNRIRQKLNLETGRMFVSENPRKAARFLQKVISSQDGDELLRRQAEMDLSRIARRALE